MFYIFKVLYYIYIYMSLESDEYYPLIDDINFNYKLQTHPRFSKFKYERDTYILDQMKLDSNKKCSETGGYIYKKIQLFVSSFLSMDTPYNGLLLYHGVGVGKSCSSILIADNFKEYAKMNNKKIIILTKPTIQQGFRNEVFNSNKTLNKIDQNEFTCTSNEYVNEWNNFLQEKLENAEIDQKELENLTNSICNENYEIYGYQEFVNKYTDTNPIKKGDKFDKYKINEIFSNCVFIIDEIHNLRDVIDDESEKKITDEKASKEMIYGIMEHLDNPIKLVLLSATPMYDRFEEFEYLINLLLVNDKKPRLEQKTIKTYVNNPNNQDAKTEIINKTKGYISYIKGNDPLIFPLILYPTNAKRLAFKTPSSSDLDFFEKDVALCQMEEYQETIYKQQDKKDSKIKCSNITFPMKEDDTLSTFDDLFTTKFVKKEKYDSVHFSYNNKELGGELLNNLKQYSIKIHNIIENVSTNKGKVFIYSEYKKGDYGGSSFLSIVLEKYGFIRKIYDTKTKKIQSNNTFIPPFTKTTDEHFKGYYVVVAGLNGEEFKPYLNAFNEDNNIYGNEIKIIIGTTNMMEGVSLNNMRQIHILEPWYNLSRNEQIVGRGVRQCSHIKLPFEERNITIFNYVAHTTGDHIRDLDKEIVETDYIEKGAQDTDLRKLQLATNKYKKIRILEELLQQNAIDCHLNKYVNSINITPILSDIQPDIKSDEAIGFKDSYDNIRLISYNYDNVSKCITDDFDDLDDLDKHNNEFLNEQFKTFMNKHLITNTKFFIKTIFKKGVLHNEATQIFKKNKLYFSYNELFEELKFYNKEIDEILYKFSLQELILNKENFADKFNKTGYIIMKGKYFIFKNTSLENIYFPFEYSTYPFNTKLNNIDDYENYNIELNATKATPTGTAKAKATAKTTATGTGTGTAKGATSDSTGKTPSKPASDKNVKGKTTKIDNKTAVLRLLEGCNDSNFVGELDVDYKNIYVNLWNNLKHKTAKKNVGLLEYKEYDAEIKEKTNNDYCKYLLNFLFKSSDEKEKKTSKKKPDTHKIFETNHFKDLLTRFYDNYYVIKFIFNYSEIIILYLKCIFYKLYIKKDELTIIEKQIHNHYSNLIVSKEPLIFKFIDWSKNQIDKYDYDFLGIIYYEYNTESEDWILHNTNYKSDEKTTDFPNLKFHKVFYGDKNTQLRPIHKKNFFIEHTLGLKEEENQKSEFQKIKEVDLNCNKPTEVTEKFCKIYNSFNHNKYYAKNNGYFNYSGNPLDPKGKNNNNIKKLSNIIGCPILNSSQNNKTSFKGISRNIFAYAMIFSVRHNVDKEKNINYYLKVSSSVEWGDHLKTIKKADNNITLAATKHKHILYCILDQIHELNYKLLAETILSFSTQNDIDILWDNEELEFKYIFKEIFNDFDFKNPIVEEIDEDTFDLYDDDDSDSDSEDDPDVKPNLKDYCNEDDKPLVKLIKYLTDENNKEFIKKINVNLKKIELVHILNKRLDDYKHKFYIYIKEIEFLIENEYVLSEGSFIYLIYYLLYDLDKYNPNKSPEYTSFYNKRWILSILETACLNYKILDLEYITSNNMLSASTDRIAESGSITKNSFLNKSKLTKTDLELFKHD